MILSINILLILLVIPIHELLHLIVAHILKVEVTSFSINPFNAHTSYKYQNNPAKVLIVSISPSIIQLIFGVCLITNTIYLDIAGIAYSTAIINLLPIFTDGWTAFRMIGVLCKKYLMKN